ncbi:transcription termination factor Rho [Lujinxingia litoralis]|uniref:Transcription termination factor Rho n=1 Tax=Lujinxingia litoralis TaxID=2211119 RepID=A0A328CDU6_9DELT|nr:transcription termination factor Rho [Lujinxingia litoralis]RAL25209.1 transcription termination factor Rho [Lujinxingia litoralis]
MSRNRSRGRRRSGNRRSSKPKADLPTLINKLADYTPVQPTDRLRLETDRYEYIGRIMDMFTPIARGQRCLITSPPKAGKTTILKAIGKAIHANYPDIEQIALLVDERPEEATDFRRKMPFEVYASTSDRAAKNHIKVAEKAFTDALEKVHDGKDVVLLLDSITRLARAYNVTHTGSGGRTLSGGVSAGALDIPRQLFGAARNLEGGGSLTIVGTALIETGSRMDEVIFQEFKGTGNMELVLDEELVLRRVFPAIDIANSGTRREEMMLDDTEKKQVPLLRRRLMDQSPVEGMQWMIKRLHDSKNNENFLRSVPQL